MIVHIEVCLCLILLVGQGLGIKIKKSRQVLRGNEDLLEGNDADDDWDWRTVNKRDVQEPGSEDSEADTDQPRRAGPESTTRVWSEEEELNRGRCRLPCMKFYPNLTTSWAFGYNREPRPRVFKNLAITDSNVSNSRDFRQRRGTSDEDATKEHGDEDEKPSKEYVCYGGACLAMDDDYDLFSLPGQEESAAEEVHNPIYVGMLISFIDVDETDQEVIMDFELEVEWEDNRLELCICEDDSIDRYAIFPRQLTKRIFTPDIVFLDAIQPEEVNEMRNNYGMWVSQLERGVSIMWKLKMKVTFTCHLNMMWYPWDVNACPIIMTSDFNNYNIMNIIMSQIPDVKHVTNNIKWNYHIEPLVSDGEARFKAFSKHGASEYQRYTGFRVLVMRKLVPPQIYIDFLHLVIVWMGFITLLPLYKERLATLGTFLIAMGEMFTEVLKEIPEKNHKEIQRDLNNFYPVYLAFLFELGFVQFIQNQFKSKYLSICVDVVFVLVIWAYWYFLTYFAEDPMFQLSKMCPDSQKTSLMSTDFIKYDYCIHNMP